MDHTNFSFTLKLGEEDVGNRDDTYSRSVGLMWPTQIGREEQQHFYLSRNR